MFSRFSYAFTLAGASLVFCLMLFNGLTLSRVQAEDAAGEGNLGASANAFTPGDIAVTGFSGTMLADDSVAPGVDPVDRTLIDPNGPALRIFDVSTLGGAPAGNSISPPVSLDVPAKQIGQVFAMTLDNGTAGGAPNLYVAASSAYGLNIVGAGVAADGKPVRLKAGAPDAVFMEGQFGALSSNSPGAIYKIDGVTGTPSFFADTAYSGTANSGAGIGGLAFDPVSRSLYASDLDTGLIHRFGLDYNAARLDSFDHGVAGRRAGGLEQVPDDGQRLNLLEPSFKADDPKTWGFTQPARRIDALAVHDGRLYYAVAEGPEIWSVGLKNGTFGDDARLEIKVKANKPDPITAIAFDGSGRIYLAQRSPTLSPYDYGSFTQGGSDVLRYVPKKPGDATAKADLWSPEPESYGVGTADASRAADGGVSLQYGYSADGKVDLNACDGTIAVTGDTLTPSAAGVQLNAVDLTRPANVPPKQSAFVDYDQSAADVADQSARGYIGSVLALRKCGADSGFPPVAADGAFPPVDDANAASGPPVDNGGGGAAAPPVEDAGSGQTAPPVEGGGGETAPPVEDEGSTQTAEVDGVSITKSAGQGPCTETGGCVFNIDITNNSGNDLPELVVGDDLTAGAANLAGATIEGAPLAPWTCTAPPNFTCKHPGPVKNGETVSLPLSFAPKGIGQEKELQNCATLNPTPGPQQQNQQANPPALPHPTTSQEKGLKFEQVAATPNCTTGQACEWEFRVTNTTAAPVSGALQWHEEFDFLKDNASARATAVTIDSVTANPAAVCSPVANNDLRQMTCQVDLVTIEPNQTFTVKMKVKADAPANAPDAALQATAFSSFFFTNQDQAIGKISTAVALVPPGGGGDQGGGAAAPVGPVCATLPVEQPQGPAPAPNPAGKPALSITKTGPAQCSDLGGCDFTIAIKNDGDAPFNGPVTVDEEVTLDGKSVPGALIVPNQTWTCTPGPTSTCTSIPQMIIGPKGTATLRVHVIYTAATGAKAMQNCASVPGQTAKACASVPLIQGPKLAIKKERVDGVCDPTCTFRITAKNIGNAKFAAPIKIVDFPSNIKSSSGDTDIKAEVISVKTTDNRQDATCLKTGNIACRIDRPLDAGESVTIELTMKTGLTDFTGDNCAMERDVLANDALQGKSCVAMQGLRHNGPNLVIEKEAPNADSKGATGHCGLTELCTFQITIKNIGDAPFTGVLHLKDTVGPGVPVRILKGGGFGTCDEAQNTQGAGGFANTSINCDIGPFPDGIKPNDTIQLEVIAEAGRGWGSDKNMNNCAELSSDADMGPAETPKKDCADVKLDPFDVDVAKTGDQSCQPGGECRFDIDIFNPNNSVTHDDPVTVTDKLSGLSSAQIVSITPAAGADPFPCSPAPTQIPFTCTGHMKLSPKEHNHYTMIVRLPADSSAVSFSNCASVGKSRASEGDPSCHAVQMAKPKSQPFSLKIEKTGPASCAPGSECPFDITLTNTGSKDHNGAVTVTDGLSNAPPMSIASIEPPLPCTEQPADIPFTCRTANDFTIPAGGKRTFRITARVPRSAETFTNCAIVGPGKQRQASDAKDAAASCVTVKSATPPPTGETPQCRGGMVRMDEGDCACPAGTTWNGRTCVRTIVSPPPPFVDHCPADRPIGDFPNCCPRGTYFDGSACRHSSPPGTGPQESGGTNGTKPVGPVDHCPSWRPVGDPPNCCPRHTYFDGRVCRRSHPPGPGPGNGGTNGTKPVGPVRHCPDWRPVGDPPNCCPRHTYFDGRVCRRSHPPGPGPGNGGTNGTKPVGPVRHCPDWRPVGDPPNCCPRHTYFDGRVCRRSHTPGPGPGNGGTNGSKPVGPVGHCPRARPVGTPPNCCPQGTVYMGHRCRRLHGPGSGTNGNGGTNGSKSCPPGTHATRSGQCERDASPTPSKPQPPKPTCASGQIGTPPNCHCPSGTSGPGCRNVVVH